MSYKVLKNRLGRVRFGSAIAGLLFLAVFSFSIVAPASASAAPIQTKPASPLTTFAASDLTPCQQVMGGGTSWFFCPTIDVIGLAFQRVEALINRMLSVDTSTFDQKTDSGKGFRTAWNSFRILSLGLIVIAGLVMIIAQALDIEILSAYTIRKVLAGIFFAAIFITLSWSLIQFLATLSNDIAEGVRTLIYAPFQSGVTKDNLANPTGFILTSLGVGAAAGAVAVGAVVALGGGGILALVLIAIIGALVAFGVLIFRQVLFDLLLIFSPIAGAAYILPNTKKLWNLWKNALVSVLVVFPIISALVAIGRVFAAVTYADGKNPINSVVAIIAYIAPYLMIPFAFRMAGGLTSAVINVAKARTAGVQGGLRKAAGGQARKRVGEVYAGTRLGGTPVGSVARALKSRNTLRYMASKNYRNPSANQQSAIAEAEFGKTTGAQSIADHNDALQAVTFANETEARRNLAKKFEYYKKDSNGNFRKDANGNLIEDTERVNDAIRAVQSSTGFGAVQGKWASNQLAAIGTGYMKNNATGQEALEQMIETAQRVSGGDKAAGARLLGSMRANSARAGRHDLGSMSYGGLVQRFNDKAELDQKLATATDPQERADAVNNYKNQIRGSLVEAGKSVDLVTLLRGKPYGVDSIARAMSGEIAVSNHTIADPNATPQARAEASQELGQLSGIIANIPQATGYASAKATSVVSEQLLRPTSGVPYQRVTEAGAAPVVQPPVQQRVGTEANPPAPGSLTEQGFNEQISPFAARAAAGGAGETPEQRMARLEQLRRDAEEQGR